MITYDEYVDATLVLKPVTEYNDGYIWVSDYWIGGTLIRYSGTKGCKHVQVVDMFSEVNIDRSEHDTEDD